MAEEKTYKIYTLEDPRDGQVRYVGQTFKSLEERLIGHLNINDKSNSYKVNWIKQLLALDLVPTITLLDEVSEFEWREAEKFWIIQMRALGFKLTNISEGGDWGDCYTNNPKFQEYMKSEIYSKNMSKALLASEKHQKAIHSKERGEKISISQKNIPEPTTTCIHCGKVASTTNISKYHNDHCYENPNVVYEIEKLRRKPSQESIEKSRKANTGRKNTEETKNIQSISAKKDYETNFSFCIFCNKKGHIRHLNRWHNDFCFSNHNYTLEEQKERRKQKKNLKLVS